MQSPDKQRISHILEYCQEIENTVARYGDSFDVFDKDLDYQRSVCFSVLQIGELVAGLSDEYKNATEKLMPWRAIKGMRNLVVHDYGNISREIVWETIKGDIPRLKHFCENEMSMDK